MRPLISVLVVNYNAGPLLSACIGAALASDMPVEVWVADNASRDTSLAELRRHWGHDPRLHIVENAANLGFAPAANRLLPKASGDFLLFLNPDCLIQPDTLRRFHTLLAADSRAGMAGPLVRNPDGSEQRSCRRRIPDPWRALVRVLHVQRFFPSRDFLLHGTPLPDSPAVVEAISGACMFVRRVALEDVGAMDEAYFLHCEDLDWFMRFHQRGWRILFDPRIEVSHAQGTCSTGEPVKVLWYKHRGMLRFYRKFFRQRYPLPLSWAVTLAVWTRFGLLAAGTWLKKAARFRK